MVLTILLLIYTFNFTDRFLITGLVGPIKAEFGIGDGAIGLLMGPVFVLLYVLLGVPFARLADRGQAGPHHRRRLPALERGDRADRIGHRLLQSRTGQGRPWGWGEAAFVAPAYSLLSNYFPARAARHGFRYPRARHLFRADRRAGGRSRAERQRSATGAMLSSSWGCRAWCLVSCRARDHPRTAGAYTSTDRTTADRCRYRRLVGLLARTPAFVLVLAGFALSALSGIAFAYWAPELLSRTLGLDPVTVKTAFALNFGLSGLVGMLAFGFVSDRLSYRGMHWPARLSAMSVVAATAAISSGGLGAFARHRNGAGDSGRPAWRRMDGRADHHTAVHPTRSFQGQRHRALLCGYNAGRLPHCTVANRIAKRASGRRRAFPADCPNGRHPARLRGCAALPGLHRSASRQAAKSWHHPDSPIAICVVCCWKRAGKSA